ncbi:MAG: hypothetical protein HC890_02180 [Chloroflexaceae bacterium]|nr:hypothetical protein [Chloroflexaceae bacterium]
MKPHQSQDITHPGNETNGYLAHSVPNGLTTILEEEESTLDLRQLWTVIKHRMRLILGMTVGVIAAVGFWTINEDPRYRGQIEILVGAPSEEASSADDLFLGFYLQSVDYETQIRVLSSQKVLVPIAETIAERYPGFQYQDFFDNNALTMKETGKRKFCWSLTRVKTRSKFNLSWISSLKATYATLSKNDSRRSFRESSLLKICYRKPKSGSISFSKSYKPSVKLTTYLIPKNSPPLSRRNW